MFACYAHGQDGSDTEHAGEDAPDPQVAGGAGGDVALGVPVAGVEEISRSTDAGRVVRTDQEECSTVRRARRRRAGSRRPRGARGGNGELAEGCGSSLTRRWSFTSC